MSSAYFQHLFGDASRGLQAQAGSRTSYARREAASAEARDPLTERELSFLAARDSIYLASVTADGWPYVQHRGGPKGFIRSLGGNLLGFADLPGNRQYISLGNVMETGRVALLAMDYPARRRLKLLGHARRVSAGDELGLDPLLTNLVPGGAETILLIDVIGFDWNCPQYIEPRFTREQIEAEFGPLRAENERLRAQLTQLGAVPA